jgi:Lhr-like helicase
MTTIVQAEKNTSKEIMEVLHPLVKEWFFSKFQDFSPTQEY